MKPADAPVDPAKMTALLRSAVLSMGPEDIGLSAVNGPEVWGVMMELGMAEVVASLVVLADGSVSIYLSDGGGAIGCGLHPDVRSAAAKMLGTAQQAIAHCLPVVRYPLPGENEVRFYLLTGNGVLSSAAMRADLERCAMALTELYYAGHGVIGMVELLGAGVTLVDEMQLEAARQGDAHDATQTDRQQLKARGRGCRILPYVGTVVRRSQN